MIERSLWLVWYRIISECRQQSLGKSRLSKGILFILMFICLPVLVSMNLFPYISRASESPPFLPMLAFRLMIVLVFSLSVAFYWVLHEVFLSDTQEFLMTLPLSKSVILIGKAVEAFFVLGFWSISFFPYLIATYGAKAFTLSSILNCLGLMVAVHIYALAILTLVVSYFSRLFSSLTSKTLETLRRFACLAGITVAAGCFMGETWHIGFFVSFYRFIERRYYVFPTYWMARAVVAPGTDSWLGGFGSVGVFLLPLLFLFLLLYVVSPESVMRLPVNAVCSIRPNRRYNLDHNRLLKWLPAKNRGLVIKDLRLMLREQGMFSMASILIIVSSIMQLVTVSLGQRNLLDIQRRATTFTTTLLPILFSLTTTLRIFGMERSSAGYTVKVVSEKSLLWSKFGLGFSLTLMGSYLSLVVARLSALVLGWEFPYFGTRLLLAFLCCSLFSLLALGTAFLYPNFKSGGVLLVGILRWYVILSIHFILCVSGISILWTAELAGLKIISVLVIIALLLWAYRRATKAVHLTVSAEY